MRSTHAIHTWAPGDAHGPCEASQITTGGLSREAGGQGPPVAHLWLHVAAQVIWSLTHVPGALKKANACLRAHLKATAAVGSAFIFLKFSQMTAKFSGACVLRWYFEGQWSDQERPGPLVYIPVSQGTQVIAAVVVLGSSRGAA